MELKEEEYIIVRNNGEEGIFIYKEALEEWRKKYNDISRNGTDMSVGMYMVEELIYFLKYYSTLDINKKWRNKI